MPPAPATTTPPKTACPVTIPEGTFTPPDPWAAVYPNDGLVWFGSEGLWTVLDSSGVHSPRKSVWWSENFPGGAEEERPEVHVTWTRLDTDTKPISNDGAATNAFTADDGWFMIAGIDPDVAGCWRVEASYKGATLSYVYERF